MSNKNNNNIQENFYAGKIKVFFSFLLEKEQKREGVRLAKYMYISQEKEAK